jgi:hypothetical protein
MSTEDESNGGAVERALDVLVYAPLGLGLWLRDLAPSLLETVVARGRAEVDRRQEQAQTHITTARSMGQVAIAFGVPELRKRASRQVDVVRGHADRLVENLAPSPATGNGSARPATPRPAPASTRAPAPAAAPPSPATTPAAASTATAPTSHRSESSAHLPIPGYDALSASQVVERLVGLGADELDAVRSYELANRNRRTILGKIDQLTA